MLDKAIASGKEKRKPYKWSKLIDRTCRNHGACDYCRANRLWKFRDKHFLNAGYEEYEEEIDAGRDEPLSKTSQDT